MKIIQITRYVAFDGTEFPTEETCREYEASEWPQRFVGLTITEVEAALNRTDLELAAAFERAGMQIRALRYEAGDLRRPRKPKEEIAGWQEGVLRSAGLTIEAVHKPAAKPEEPQEAAAE